MAREYIGESKSVLKLLEFLIKEYQMKYIFQSFDEYMGFHGPINTYSFYNEHGCFTVLQVVQRGEWGWYTSKKVHENLHDLLETEIRQSDFTQQSTFSYKRNLKILGTVIRKQVETAQHFFGIAIDER